ncbi:hypothetical protein XA68_16170 [Ophiocordyceps unilateralis]|uniref:Yeast cell wall synthesis Kre9/Knh1-like N-terminal domain-containing protein n=1 Tax=Ophiocordyceps unilateralis TaxID=268505 RepID=A0A2A9P6R0_OPHUN|nr:hypothetical protein XA68_16170 [Ophiocordyceps unilateralis]
MSPLLTLFFLFLLLLPLLSAAYDDDEPTAGFNPILKPKAHERIPAGSRYTLVWDTPAVYAAGSLTIGLIGGDEQASQESLANITDAVPSSAGRYTWHVASHLGTKRFYGLVLRWGRDPSVFQYSNPFHIIPAPPEPSVSTSSAPTSTLSHTAVAVAMGTSPPLPAHQTAASPPLLLPRRESLALVAVALAALVVLA